MTSGIRVTSAGIKTLINGIALKNGRNFILTRFIITLGAVTWKAEKKNYIEMEKKSMHALLCKGGYQIMVQIPIDLDFLLLHTLQKLIANDCGVSWLITYVIIRYLSNTNAS